MIPNVTLWAILTIVVFYPPGNSFEGSLIPSNLTCPSLHLSGAVPITPKQPQNVESMSDDSCKVRFIDQMSSHSKDSTFSFSPQAAGDFSPGKSCDMLDECAKLMEGESDVFSLGSFGTELSGDMSGHQAGESSSSATLPSTDVMDEDEFDESLLFEMSGSTGKENLVTNQNQPKPWMKSAAIQSSTAEYVVNAQGLFGDLMMGVDVSEMQDDSQLTLATDHVSMDKNKKSDAMFALADGVPMIPAVGPWILMQGVTPVGLGGLPMWPSIGPAAIGVPANSLNPI